MSTHTATPARISVVAGAFAGRTGVVVESGPALADGLGQARVAVRFDGQPGTVKVHVANVAFA